MPTYEQREFAGLNTVSKQDIPVDKHALKQEKDEEHALALEQKKIRLLNDDNHKMMEYKHALTVTF